MEILTPEYLLRISEGSEEISEYLHVDIMNRLIERIMMRFNRGDEYILTSQDKWQLEVLQEAGYLLEDIQKEISKRTKQQEKEIAEAFEDAGVTAITYDDKIYSAAGLSPIPLLESPYMIRLMQRMYEATLGEWKNFTRTIANESQQLFIRAMDKAYTDVAIGSISYTQAFKEAIDNIIKDGVYVTYPSGHKDTIETATLRCVRTGISQMSGQIQLERMREMNCDLAIVSSHMGARPTHQVWQGKVYHIDWGKMDIYRNTPKIFSKGSKSKYPDFVISTGYGSVDGLCGANCRHNFSPYFEGMDNPFEDYDSDENNKAYEIEQRQRTLERRIRNTKREVQGMQTAVKNCKNDKERFKFQQDLDRTSYLLQKQNKAYKEFCQEHNLKELRERLQIARWDRKQAAQARGAAARYKNAKGID